MRFAGISCPQFYLRTSAAWMRAMNTSVRPIRSPIAKWLSVIVFCKLRNLQEVMDDGDLDVVGVGHRFLGMKLGAIGVVQRTMRTLPASPNSQIDREGCSSALERSAAPSCRL
jgi:hypothetical protein